MELAAAGQLGRDAAALTTALLWSFSALAWSVAGRRVGSVAVTSIRIALAAAILLLIHWAALGRPWPEGLEGESAALLIASGLFGAFAADLFLFRGLLLIGPRQGMLIQSLAPIFTAAAAWALTGETIRPRGALGIVVTVGGIALVLSQRSGRLAWQATRRQFVQGVAMSIVAALLVSIGYVLARKGLSGGERLFSSGPPLAEVPPFSGATIRVAAAAAATWAILPLIGRLGPTLRAAHDRRAMAVIVAGTLVGPVVGIWLSMIALAGVTAGVAVALINTSPLMLIPIAYLAYRERPSQATVLGTCLAVAGVALLLTR